MGLYNDVVMPRLVGRVCGHRFFDPWRQRVCEGLGGEIVEVGFGTGTNLRFLPPAVRRVYAVEPSLVARAAARAAVERTSIDVEFIELGTTAVARGSLDAALSAFTLCSVDDPRRVLGQIAAVVKPGAPLHFLEHGLAPDAATARWQHRLNGLEQRLAGGCHLTRDPLRLLVESGFEVDTYVQEYARGPRPWSYFTLGVARAPRP